MCAYESMQAGLYRLKRLGISRLTLPTGLSSAMNQLPDEAVTLAAASHIERELQITPWNLSSNFVSCTNQVIYVYNCIAHLNLSLLPLPLPSSLPPTRSWLLVPKIKLCSFIIICVSSKFQLVRIWVSPILYWVCNMQQLAISEALYNVKTMLRL